MKKIIVLLIIVFFSLNYCYSQEKKNIIVFAEYIDGFSFMNSSQSQPNFGVELNYQFLKNLISTRFILNDFEHKKGGSFGFGQPIVREKTNEKIDELSLLFGRRYIKNGHSYSISIGASYNFYNKDYIKKVDGIITQLTNDSKNFLGIPYELNIKWFKKKKSKYLGIIPLNKTTSFGNSIGLKIYGNITNKSYWGFGITLGIGYHKIYQEE